MKVIQDILLGPIQAALARHPASTCQLHRRKTDDADQLEVSEPNCVINCRSTMIRVAFVTGWKLEDDGNIKPQRTQFETKLEEFLDALQALGFTRHFRVHSLLRMMDKTKLTGYWSSGTKGSNSGSLVETLRNWIAEGCLSDMIDDESDGHVAFASGGDHFKDTLINVTEDQNTGTGLYLKDMTHPHASALDAGESIEGGFAVLSSLPSINPVCSFDRSRLMISRDEDAELNEPKHLKQVLSDIFGNSLSSLMPAELMGAHYTKPSSIHIKHVTALKTHCVKTGSNTMFRANGTAQGTPSRRSSGQGRVLSKRSPNTLAELYRSSLRNPNARNARFPTMIIPRFSRASDAILPLTSDCIDCFVSCRTLVPGNGQIKQPSAERFQMKGPWYMSLPDGLKIKIIDSAAAVLLSDSDWEDVVAIILSDHKFPPQWPVAFSEMPDHPNGTPVRDQLFNWCHNLTKRIALIHAQWDAQDNHTALSRLPSWLARMTPEGLDPSKVRNIGELIRPLSFGRNNRHGDEATYQELSHILSSILQRPLDKTSRSIPSKTELTADTRAPPPPPRTSLPPNTMIPPGLEGLSVPPETGMHQGGSPVHHQPSYRNATTAQGTFSDQPSLMNQGLQGGSTSHDHHHHQGRSPHRFDQGSTGPGRFDQGSTGPGRFDQGSTGPGRFDQGPDNGSQGQGSADRGYYQAQGMYGASPGSRDMGRPR